MNTFLPYPLFDESAAVLDDSRLRKQLVECGQILDVLSGKSDGWKNHPAVKQWVGFEESLISYTNQISAECSRRNFNSIPIQKVGYGKFPGWLGDEKFHSSHRSKLLWKGRVDAVCYSLRRFLRVKSINEWLVKYGFSEKNVLTRPEVEYLEKYSAEIGCKVGKNHYTQFSWTEPDNLPYVWPSKV